jgi:putative membrane protein
MLWRLITILGALAMGYGAANAQAAKPNDAQIAHIAYTAGTIDIKAAPLALEKSKNNEVRAFAEDMVRDHKAVNEQALALVLRHSPPPDSSENHNLR